MHCNEPCLLICIAKALRIDACTWLKCPHDKMHPLVSWGFDPPLAGLCLEGFRPDFISLCEM